MSFEAPSAMRAEMVGGPLDGRTWVIPAACPVKISFPCAPVTGDDGDYEKSIDSHRMVSYERETSIDDVKRRPDLPVKYVYKGMDT